MTGMGASNVRKLARLSGRVAQAVGVLAVPTDVFFMGTGYDRVLIA
jgi:hypothetical protein